MQAGNLENKRKNKEIKDKFMKMLTTHGNGNVRNADKMNLMVGDTWSKLMDLGCFTPGEQVQIGNHEWVKDCWKNEPAYVVGASVSLSGFDLSLLDGKHTIGINHMIERYDRFEFFLFLDRRFMELTTYDMNKYKGTVFYSNSCNRLSNKNQVVFKKMPNRVNTEIPMNLSRGLYNGCMSGLAALHLALITGANPIYMLGCDTPKEVDANNFHVKNYTGAAKGGDKLKKYIGAYGYYKAFSKYADRIVNVCVDGHIDVFKKMSMKNFSSLIARKKTICHVGTMKSISEMGDISRQIYELCDGVHEYVNINDEIPKADIYILHCFINQSQKFINFARPHKEAKIISIVHSSSSCMPAKNSDKVITITDAWKKVMQKKGVQSEVIHAGIDSNLYNKKIDYNNAVFGRITRYSAGKVHKDFEVIVKDILEKEPESKCIMISNKMPFKHERLVVDDSVKINEIEKKVDRLSQLSVFADMHGTFVETFSLGLLEAMASGLAIILYSEAPQAAMREVLGDAGIICETKSEFATKLKNLLVDEKAKRHYGEKAKLRAKEFTIEKMINKYNEVINNL